MPSIILVDWIRTCLLVDNLDRQGTRVVVCRTKMDHQQGSLVAGLHGLEKIRVDIIAL